MDEGFHDVAERVWNEWWDLYYTPPCFLVRCRGSIYHCNIHMCVSCELCELLLIVLD